MGGLATALALAKQGFTNIQVFETASNLGFVGAGIQLAPNMARILDRLGCWKDIEKEAVDLKSTSIRGMKSDTKQYTFLTWSRRSNGQRTWTCGFEIHQRYIRLPAHGWT